METFLYQLGPDDQNYLSFLKPLLSGRANVKLSAHQNISAILEVTSKAKGFGTSKVITSSPKLLQLLLGKIGEKLPSLEDYAGSIIEKYGVEFLIVNPLEQLITVSEGKFVMERYLSKFLTPETWLQMPVFKWELFDPENTESIVEEFEKATFISIDIETGKEIDRIITCVGFTATFIDPVLKTVRCRTVVVPMTDMYNYTFVKVLCELRVFKVFQNGKYDNAYFLRYGIKVWNWGGDTQHLFHSWYSELPKRLDFITSFMLRKWQYWKDESSTGDLMEYYQYNAKDCYTTAMDWIALCREVPSWAWTNYLQEFPLVFPCLVAEMTGLKRDAKVMEEEEARFNASLEKRLARLRVSVSCPSYNPGSWQQNQRVWKMLGCEDITGTGKIEMDKVSFRHPLNKRLIEDIKSYKEDRKLVGAYLRDINPKPKKDENPQKSWLGRIFYSLNPHGTDTARLASKESAFWCGMQIQNIPRDRKDVQVKRGIISDTGFLFGEGDYEQNEARGVAYLSGDTNLISAVDDPTTDFHGRNASAFFGIKYEKIVRSTYDTDTLHWVHDTIDKAIRDLSKRTNHGANYNMGAGVLLDTMGIANVLAAKRLLGLPSSYSLKAVCQHLLDVYAKTYPVVKGPYYDKIKSDVSGSRMLVSPLGWTRYCFGNPGKNKQDLNRYVAHPSQNLAAGALNIAWRKVFYNVYLRNPEDFKLNAQIHDSILFQYRVGYEHLAWEVKECMEFDVPVKDTFGKLRTLRVPVALKGDSNRWSEVRTLRCARLEW